MNKVKEPCGSIEEGRRFLAAEKLSDPQKELCIMKVIGHLELSLDMK
jgi:hypothetical protein